MIPWGLLGRKVITRPCSTLSHILYITLYITITRYHYQIPLPLPLTNGLIKVRHQWGQRHAQGANSGSNGKVELMPNSKWLPPAHPNPLLANVYQASPLRDCPLTPSHWGAGGGQRHPQGANSPRAHRQTQLKTKTQNMLQILARLKTWLPPAHSYPFMPANVCRPAHFDLPKVDLLTN
jgi:hypothetical protein